MKMKMEIEMEIEMSDESHERGRKMSMKEDEHGFAGRELKNLRRQITDVPTDQ